MLKSKVFSRVLVFIIIACIAITAVAELVNHYEKYSSTAKSSLLNKLNNDDPIAMEYYISNFINDNIYLFDGDLTLRLMAEQHNIEVEALEKLYKASDCSTLQKFYNEYLEDNVEVISFTLYAMK